MYEELVKALRDPIHSLDCEFCNRKCCYPDGKCDSKCIIIQAADAIEELRDAQERWIEQERKVLLKSVPKWISVTEDTPGDFVSVQAHMTDAGQFPSVREAYMIDGLWFFPALEEFHPVDVWKQFNEPPKEGT